MGITHAERLRRSKKKDRERRHRKATNLRRNLPARAFQLDVELDGQWRTGVRYFRDAEQVEAYRSATEARRKSGAEIAPGRVLHLGTGKVVLEIAGSKLKGTLSDTIADGAKADPDVTASPREAAAELEEASGDVADTART